MNFDSLNFINKIYLFSFTLMFF